MGFVYELISKKAMYIFLTNFFRFDKLSLLALSLSIDFI